jgi:Secretion system C-terminal sorting domain/Ig-like domain CHU_C associated
MKKIIQMVIVIIFTITTTNAQGVDWNWAVKGGGTLEDKAESIVVDALGNRYVLGNFKSPTISFGSIVLMNANSSTTNPTSDFFLLKYDSNGSLVWANRYGNLGNDVGNSMTIDSLGYPYISGFFDSSILPIPKQNKNMTISFINLNATTGSDFAIRFDTNGFALWANNFGLNSVESNSIKINGTGDLYVLGQVFSYTNNTHQVYLRKINNLSGLVVWETYGKTTNGFYEYGNAVDVDSAGNAYIIGTYDGVINFGNSIVNPTILTLTPNTVFNDEMFLVKYNALGVPQWIKRAYDTGGNYVTGSSVRVDNNGNVFISGVSWGSNVRFGNGKSFTASTNSNIFVVKYSPSTTLPNTVNAQWVNSVNGLSDSLGNHSLDVDNAGFVYVGANDINNAAVVKIEDLSGQNINLWKSNGLSAFVKSVFYTNNSIYCTGSYKSGFNTTFGPSTIPSSNGLEDAFVAKIGPCTYPSPPTISKLSSCLNQNYILTANLSNPANYGVANWYSSLTSTTPLGNPYVTPTINLTTSYYAEVKNSCGVSSRVRITLNSFDCQIDDDKTRIMNVKNTKSVLNEGINIFPNPSSGIFNIDLNEFKQGTIEVYNQLGARVKNVELNDEKNDYQLDLSGFAKGIYILNLINDNQKISKKIVVE